MISLMCRIKKTKQINKQTRNRLVNTADWWLPQGKEEGKWVKQVKGMNKFKIPILKINQGDENTAQRKGVGNRVIKRVHSWDNFEKSVNLTQHKEEKPCNIINLFRKSLNKISIQKKIFRTTDTRELP